MLNLAQQNNFLFKRSFFWAYLIPKFLQNASFIKTLPSLGEDAQEMSKAIKSIKNKAKL